ncbi:hypothetical protein CHO01_31830 [Cellulomonas hominis]|nr:hypothetical protein CHO01_31830 [Cellulomonas hominis]
MAVVAPPAALGYDAYRDMVTAQRQAEAAALRSNAFANWIGRESARRDAITLGLARKEAAEARAATMAAADTGQGVLDAAPHADEALRSALSAAVEAARSEGASVVDDLDLDAARAVPGTAAAAAQLVQSAAPAVTESQAAWQAAEDARIAAEKAAQEAAARAASGQSVRTQQAVDRVTAPGGTRAGSGVVWSVSVVNSGGQSTVDACGGGLTRYSFDIDGHPYLPIHIHCGGGPILSLRVASSSRSAAVGWTASTR